VLLACGVRRLDEGLPPGALVTRSGHGVDSNPRHMRAFSSFFDTNVKE
jgi:hypothetical protein